MNVKSKFIYIWPADQNEDDGVGGEVAFPVTTWHKYTAHFTAAGQARPSWGCCNHSCLVFWFFDMLQRCMRNAYSKDNIHYIISEQRWVD